MGKGRPIRRALVATALVAGVAAALAVGVAARSADSTKIVRWNRIGDAGLNTSRSAVVAHYGTVHRAASPSRKRRRAARLDIDPSSRSRVVHSRRTARATRLPDGIKVGIKTPNTTTWKGFTFNSTSSPGSSPFCYGGIQR